MTVQARTNRSASASAAAQATRRTTMRSPSSTTAGDALTAPVRRTSEAVVDRAATRLETLTWPAGRP